MTIKHLNLLRQVILPSEMFLLFYSQVTFLHPRRYNLRALSLDFLELLERFIPTEYEMKLIHNYECEGRPLDELSEEDRFMVRFSKIPQLSQRISALTFMGNFPESVQLMQPVSSAEGVKDFNSVSEERMK